MQGDGNSWWCGGSSGGTIPWKTAQQFVIKLSVLQPQTCVGRLMAALFKVIKTWKQPRCPSASKWTNKLCCVPSIKASQLMRSVDGAHILCFCPFGYGLPFSTCIYLAADKTGPLFKCLVSSWLSFLRSKCFSLFLVFS